MKFKKAFSLIEAIVATSVLMIGVLGIAGFFATSTGTGRSASNTSVASNLASGALDEEMARSYDELTPGTSARIHLAPNQTDPLYNFEKQVTITLIDSNLATSIDDIGLKKIDVVIFYQEASHEKNIQMSTIKVQV